MSDSVLIATGAVELIRTSQIIQGNGLPLTGAVITIYIVRDSDGKFLDFTPTLTGGYPTTFTTPTTALIHGTMTEFDSAHLPGVYSYALDTSKFTGVVANDKYKVYINHPVPWTPTYYYPVGHRVNCNGNWYVCTTAGTSGSAGPILTGTGVSDGTVVWTGNPWLALGSNAEQSGELRVSLVDAVANTNTVVNAISTSLSSGGAIYTTLAALQTSFNNLTSNGANSLATVVSSLAGTAGTTLSSVQSALSTAITTAQTNVQTSITGAVNTLEGTTAGTTLTTVLNAVNTMAASTNLSAVQSALSGAITNAVSTLAGTPAGTTLLSVLNAVNTNGSTITTAIANAVTTLAGTPAGTTLASLLSTLQTAMGSGFAAGTDDLHSHRAALTAAMGGTNFVSSTDNLHNLQLLLTAIEGAGFTAGTNDLTSLRNRLEVAMGGTNFVPGTDDLHTHRARLESAMGGSNFISGTDDLTSIRNRIDVGLGGANNTLSVPQQVWVSAETPTTTANAGTTGYDITLIRKWITNAMKEDMTVTPTTVILYDDNNTTPLKTWTMHDSTNGAVIANAGEATSRSAAG